VFTRFAIAWWLTRKFGIDKRKVTLSALVRSGEISREQALAEVAQPPYDPKRMEDDRRYVIKKLGIGEESFAELVAQPNRTFADYPSYYFTYERFKKLANAVFRAISPTRPMMTFDLAKAGAQSQERSA